MDVPILRQRIVFEATGCNNLNNIDVAYEFLVAVAKAIGVTLYSQPIVMKTPGQGLTGIAILLESGMIIHTWSEYEFLDFYLESCKDFDPRKITPLIKLLFGATEISVVVDSKL